MALHVDYEVRWRNYRAFEDTGWLVIRPLTVLIGRNNSGKSSLISPLLLMAQTMSSRDTQTPLVIRGPLVDAGTFKSVVHNHDVTLPLRFGFRYHVHDRDSRELKKVGAYPPGAVEVMLTGGQRSEDILLQEFEVFDIYRRPFLKHVRESEGTYNLDELSQADMSEKEREAVQGSRPVNFLFSPAAVLRAIQDQEPTDRAARRPKFSNGFTHYLNAIAFSFEELRNIFRTLSYIGPLRERPRRYYEIASEMPASVGTRGEHVANIVHRKYHNLAPKLNAWIKRFDFGSRLRVQTLSDALLVLSLESGRPTMRTNIADAGFGTSQVLPLIVQALTAPHGSLTIAEQPEIHLNPRLQCVLADLFVEMANGDHRVVVETHSEHLVLRLRRLIADGKIEPSKVAIYFVEKHDGMSSVRPLPIEADGHIPLDQWPEGFFEETLHESMALAAAQSKVAINKAVHPQIVDRESDNAI